jgi:thiol-disulfide isomerase/thioredoxin
LKSLKYHFRKRGLCPSFFARNSRYGFLLWAMASLLLACTDHSEQGGKELKMPQVLPELNLIDATGAPFNLKTQLDGQTGVFLFLSPECPLCQGYAPLLRELVKRYGTLGFRFFAVFPGKLYSNAEVCRFLTAYHLPLPGIMDADFKLTSFFGAEVTPEVFIYGKSGEQLYRGRIDNLSWETGQKRLSASEHELEDALAALTAGRKPEVNHTQASGCIIEH